MKLKDTKVGAFLKDKAPKVLDVVGDLLPNNGTLGIVKKVDGEMRFYIANVSTGKGITSSVNDSVAKSMEFYDAKLSNPIGLASILEMAGAEIVSEVPVEDESGAVRNFIDLSQPDKATLIELLTK